MTEPRPEDPDGQVPEPAQPPGPGPYGPPHYPVAGYPPPGDSAAGYPPAGYPMPYPPAYPPPYSGPVGTLPAPQSQHQPQSQPQYLPRYQPRPSFPHPEPREYHEMYRTWTYRWWRPVVGILLLALGMLIVLPLVAFPVLIVGILIENSGQSFGDALLEAGTFETLTPSGLLYLNLSLGGMILWTWGLVRVLHQMRPRWLSSVVPKLRWSYLFACFGLAVVALIAQVVVGMLVPESGNPEVTAGSNPVNGTTIALALVILLTTPLQAAGEEYVFRGYLMQAVGSLSRRRWVALLVTATLFAMAHGLQNFPLFFDRFMFGLIAGWLVIRTGGLEAGIAMHVLNNYLAFGLALAFGDISDTLTVTEVSWWNIPVTLTQSIVYAGLAAWVAKAMRLQRRTSPPLEEALL
jgi:membrane protease YdiL (CAAX protease family)